jgi:hypothetical protein
MGQHGFDLTLKKWTVNLIQKERICLVTPAKVRRLYAGEFKSS